MKKLITCLLAAAMILSLTACGNKKEELTQEEDTATHFTLTIEHDKGLEDSFEISTAINNNFVNAMQGTLATGITYYEIEEGRFISINNQKESETSRWECYINDELYTGDVNDLTIKDGDVIKLVYVTDEEAPAEEKKEEEPAAQVLLGGWETYETFEDSSLKPEDIANFEKANEELVGVGYAPVRILANQIVSGINYAFLAQGITMTGDPEVNYYIMVVYKDTDDTCEIKAINKLEPTNLQLKAEDAENLLGGWMILTPDEKTKFSDKKIQTSFENATKDYKDLKFTPIQVLATQVVSGTNYMALVYGQTNADKPKGDLYILTWYEDLQGKASISEIEALNLAYYVAGE